MAQITKPISANSAAESSALQVLFTFAILAAYVAMGRSRIYALINEGKFPRPLKIGRSSRWLKSEIDTWISEQVAARHGATE
jgi:predicted DNA-binding transcriptional regulator AlpA